MAEKYWNLFLSEMKDACGKSNRKHGKKSDGKSVDESLVDW